MKTMAKQIFWNALLLTGANLLMRTVSVSFGVFVSNRAGEEAMGLYSLMSGVYGFALTLATSGIQLGVTRLIADALGRDNPQRIRSVMRCATLYALTFGLFATGLLMGLATPIGMHWLKDGRTVSSLRLFAISLPFIALSSVWNGYFTAVRRVYKNAAVQVSEQGIKIALTMYLLASFAGRDVERILQALVLGGALAEILSFFPSLFLYLHDRKHHYKGRPIPQTGVASSLLRLSLPIALTTYIRSGLVTIQHVLIPEGLRNSGASHAAALRAYGSIHSMALPIILYPAALISSFSGLLVPALAECVARKSNKRVCYIVGRVWSLALLFSFGAAGLLICFSSEIGEALYPGTEAGRYIHLLAPLIPIMYVDTATDAMMKGLGAQVYSMNVNLADALISVLLVWLLVPRYGIGGYLFTVYFSELFNTVLSINHLLNISRPAVRLLKWVYKPLLCTVGATAAVRLLAFLFPSLLSSFPLVGLCALTLLLYLGLLLITGALEREDLCWLSSLFRREAIPSEE